MIITTTILTGKKALGSSAGHVKGKATKGSSSVTVKAADTSTTSAGQKRKTDLTQQDHEHPPAKRGKAGQHSVPQDPIKRLNTKKRPSEAADMAQENDPRTPVPSKRAKIGLNTKSKGAPIRRTGESVFFSVQMKLI